MSAPAIAISPRTLSDAAESLRRLRADVVDKLTRAQQAGYRPINEQREWDAQGQARAYSTVLQLIDAEVQQ